MSAEIGNKGVTGNSGSDSVTSQSSKSAGKMAEKKVDYAAMGAEIAQTLTAANSMSLIEVKGIKARIYNLFKGVDQDKVDFGVAAYFLLNDPSSHADWGKANPIVIGGNSVPAVSIAGGIISMAQGDGLLRKFLSTAYEQLAPVVIKHTPGVAESLNARAAKHGVIGADPIAAVSWVRGIYAETSANAGARALLRDKATRSKSDMRVLPIGEGETVHAPVKGAGGNQEYYM